MLNQQLYDLLVSRFPRVRVSNEGEAMSARYVGDRLWVDSFGESYCVDCPFCNDTRQRLSINHRYGVFDPETGSDHRFLARCFNEDCLKVPGRIRALGERVFGLVNANVRRRTFTAPPPKAADAGPLPEVPAPGKLVHLGQLPADHPAVAYLRGRGFDPEEISDAWRVGYCVQAAPGNEAVLNRLVLPVVMGGVWVGWLARHVGELAWKGAGLPKYLFPPGLAKSRVLYNHDRAAERPLVVVCEGPTDVWRVGPCAVALGGKHASQHQVQLLARGWQGKPVVVLLDGDAKEDAAHLCDRLRPLVGDRLVRVDLEPDCDPADLSREDLWERIRRAAAEQGVALPITLGNA